MLMPLFISRILKFFDGQSNLQTVLLDACYLMVCVCVNAILHHPYFQLVYKLGFRMRVACSGLIYKKCSTLKICGPDAQSNGQIINILANDLSRIEFLFMFLPYILIGPIQVGLYL